MKPKNLTYELRRIPADMGGPAVCVIRTLDGRTVFESKSLEECQAECARLNAGGDEVVHLVRPAERLERQKDGSVLRIPIIREVRPDF